MRRGNAGGKGADGGIGVRAFVAVVGKISPGGSTASDDGGAASSEVAARAEESDRSVDLRDDDGNGGDGDGDGEAKEEKGSLKDGGDDFCAGKE